jgi:hypothetical protein
VAGAVGFLFQQLANAKEKHIGDLDPQVQALVATSQKFTSAYGKLKSAQAQSLQVAALLNARFYWGDVLSQLHGCLIQAEADAKQKLSVKKPTVEVGIWIESFGPDTGANPVVEEVRQARSNPRNGRNARIGQDNTPPPDTSADQTAVTMVSSSYRLTCRAIDLTTVDQAANVDIANTFEGELKACPLFDPKTTQITGNITTDDSNGTFLFNVIVTLATPLNL